MRTNRVAFIVDNLQFIRCSCFVCTCIYTPYIFARICAHTHTLFVWLALVFARLDNGPMVARWMCCRCQRIGKPYSVIRTPTSRNNWSFITKTALGWCTCWCCRTTRRCTLRWIGPRGACTSSGRSTLWPITMVRDVTWRRSDPSVMQLRSRGFSAFQCIASIDVSWAWLMFEGGWR
jgi:hypothetical protein